MVKITSQEQMRWTEYEWIREKPFTKIHGKPTRSDYDSLKDKIVKVVVTVQIPVYDNWTDKYGILAEVIGNIEYHENTGLNHEAPAKPEDYDPSIRENSSTVTKARKEYEWEITEESYTVIEGTREGICANIRDALDMQYYEQLEDTDLGYSEISIKDYLDHLTTQWCKLNTKAIQEMKDRQFRGWDKDEHITAFGRRLTREQHELRRQNVTIMDSDKLQHYLEQIYVSNIFDRRELTDWEKKPKKDKTYTHVLQYFQGIVAGIELFEERRGGTAKKVRYKSAAAMEDSKEKVGREIRDDIEYLALKKEQVKECPRN